jgi:hypothetical protein
MRLNIQDSVDKDGDPIIAIEYDEEFKRALAKKLKRTKLTSEEIHNFLIKSFDKFISKMLD